MSFTLTAEDQTVKWPCRTRTEELRLRLSDDIVRGQLAPGAALGETELARRFSVSRPGARSHKDAGGERASRGARAPGRRGGAANA